MATHQGKASRAKPVRAAPAAAAAVAALAEGARAAAASARAVGRTAECAALVAAASSLEVVAALLRGGELDPRVASRLQALEPCLTAQVAAADAGRPAGSSRGLVPDLTHQRAVAAKHLFEPGVDVQRITAQEVRSRQRGRRKSRVVTAAAGTKEAGEATVSSIADVSDSSTDPCSTTADSELDKNAAFNPLAADLVDTAESAINQRDRKTPRKAHLEEQKPMNEGDPAEAVELASDKPWGDRKHVLAAVAQDGWALQFASVELRGDREVVLAAVAQNGEALAFVSETLRVDSEVVLAAYLQRSGRMTELAELMSSAARIGPAVQAGIPCCLPPPLRG